MMSVEIHFVCTHRDNDNKKEAQEMTLETNACMTLPFRLKKRKRKRIKTA